MNSMHIVQVTPYYPPAYAYGGIPRIVEGLSKSLETRGHTLTVLTTDVLDANRRCSRPIWSKQSNIRICSLPNLSNRLAYRQLYLPLYGDRHLSKIHQATPIDILHLHGHRHLLNTVATRWANKHNTPYVFTANGTLRRHEQHVRLKVIWDRCISGQIPFKAQACIAVSKTDHQIHLDWGISPERIHTIHNGLDEAEFSQRISSISFRQKLKIPFKAPIILYLGRISPRKGVDTLVQAFNCLQHPTAHLVIAGSDMGGLSKAKRLAKDSNQIHFVDTVSGDERLSLLHTATLMVYASKDEIFGLSPFEGLLSGTPVIVSDDCGCGEIVQQSQSGLVVPYGHVQKLTVSMHRLLTSPALCRDMVKKGQAYIRQHITWESIATQHEQLYETLIT